MDQSIETTFDEIRRRPWNSHYVQVPGWQKRYPTMLTAEELRMLTWLAENAPAAGDVADLGCFLGGSSMALATGVRRARASGRALGRVHSYDRFEIDEKLKHRYLYKRGHPFYAGTDILPLFRTLTERHAELIEPVPGDVLEQGWGGGDIAVLFVDLAKSRALNDHILRTFFPRLVAGSILIQQDFLFYRNPWLHATMHRLEGAVEMLAHAEDNSVVFGVRRPLTEADIAPCLSSAVTLDDMLASVEHFRPRFPERRQQEMLDALVAAVRAAPDAEKAWQYPNAAQIPAAG